ncbi:tetraspanin-2A [Chelonus insularis]|uniref:tetraspanin-2A n=1 Tax=Chelonus insularis TaxID=460826 RepID=UPI00158955F3|nr:tetraspanin-2A [Chelonus insularis]
MMVTKKNLAAVLESQIGCVKYTIFSLNAVLWILGGGMFGLAVWLRVEPGFQEWVEMLNMSDYYTGIYILIVTSIAVMVLAFYGSAAALMEHTLLLYINIGLQVLFFILGLAGAAVLLDYSTYDSQIQPIIHRSMTTLIMNSHQPRASQILKIIQENIGCCGASGPMDYLDLLKPLPTECRDTVTGNAFFHGCVDELTWFLESRSGWLAGLALALCMLHVVQASLSLILIQAKQKEDEAVIYKR